MDIRLPYNIGRECTVSYAASSLGGRAGRKDSSFDRETELSGIILHRSLK